MALGLLCGLFAAQAAADASAAAGRAPAAAAAGASAAAAAPAVRPATASPPVVLVLGDSLSAGYGIRVEAGWVALLQQRLAGQGYGYRVVNASVSGETTGGALARLPRALALHRPALVLIALGGNDGLRGLPIEELQQNLRRLVDQSRAAGARVLLLGQRIPSNYGPQYTERFFASYAAIAAERRIARVPFMLERIAGDERWFQADRIHPSAAAQPLLLETVWPALKPLLGKPGR